MGIEVSPLPGTTFGAVVTGTALGSITSAEFDAVYEAWLEYALLIFPRQHLTKHEQSTLARRFGDLEFDVAPVANTFSDGSVRPDDGTDDVMAILKGNMGWHCDSTYMPVQAKGAVFTAHIVPDAGGETGWADMRAAYDDLEPDVRARIEDLRAHHSLAYSQSKLGHRHRAGSNYSGYGMTEAPQLRPIVKVHPETGRKSLVIGRHAHDIPGMDPDESERLLADLVEFACQPPRVYEHRWTPGDAVVWDNRCLLHRARPWDMHDPRLMFHVRIAGDPASESALAPAHGDA